jgi:2-polyprenyl-6-methoxyphenol hydroxylase-like FAD-dependent oxidoreductase
VLYEGAKSAGVTIRFSAPVSLVNQEIPAVTLADGQVLEADLIVGADGKFGENPIASQSHVSGRKPIHNP